ncbi:MAG: pilus assembly PilX N-terminal domain-containing protein, partial [Planctomycetota bacterium]
MFRRWNQKKGAVLIVCLGILAVLTLLGISFSQLMIVERSASANYSDGVRAKFAAQSGIEYATAYLRKLARLKQHSDPGTPGDPTLPGDGWYFDPFWTDEQGRPIFDINPDPAISTILGHPPAFRLGTITDANSADLYSEAYTGCVHGTYYEEGTPTTSGYPGNYFQVKIQSSASQFYLNVHPAHLIGLENMLTSFIRACLSSGRTHRLPQADGSTIVGRAFFAGFSPSPGDYETTSGSIRVFVRTILQARATLPGGLFSTKEQLFQILQDLESGTLPLPTSWPSGTLGAEEIYNDLKNFVTCQAWVDDSVLYLNPESSSTQYAGSVATTLNSFPGSTGTSGTARDPDPILAGTISGTGPYFTFIPSAVETYYACRELSIGGVIPPTGTGTPITGRAPIDLNAAPKEVLTAVFAGLTAKRPDLFDGSSYFGNTSRSEISFAKAEALALRIVEARHGIASPSGYNTYFNTFYSWDQFYGFLNSFAAGTGTAQVTQEQSDIIKAMVNPNTDINKFNPDTTLRKRVDKGDITRSAMPG